MNVNERSLRYLIVGIAVLGWVLLVASLIGWFVVGSFSFALTLAALAGVIGVGSRFGFTALLHQMPTSIDASSGSAFERYFAELERKEQTMEDNITPTIVGGVLLAAAVVMGQVLQSADSPVMVVALYALWALTVFGMVVYTASIDDLFEMVAVEPTASPTDREEETPPWS